MVQKAPATQTRARSPVQWLKICERSLAGVLELYRQSMIQIGWTVNFNKVQMQYSCYEGGNYPQRPKIFLYKAVKLLKNAV